MLVVGVCKYATYIDDDDNNMWLKLGLLFPDNTVASSDCNYGINPNLNARATNKAASRYHYVIVGLLCMAWLSPLSDGLFLEK